MMALKMSLDRSLLYDSICMSVYMIFLTWQDYKNGGRISVCGGLPGKQEGNMGDNDSFISLKTNHCCSPITCVSETVEGSVSW